MFHRFKCDMATLAPAVSFTDGVSGLRRRSAESYRRLVGDPDVCKDGWGWEISRKGIAMGHRFEGQNTLKVRSCS